MGDPLIVFPAASAAFGAWILLTGRTWRGLPRWPLEGARLRAGGAYVLLFSILVMSLAVTGNKGFAFVMFAMAALSVAALGLFIRAPQQRS
jgi:hypothetical protein